MNKIKRIVASSDTSCSEQADALFAKVIESATNDKLAELFAHNVPFAGRLGQALKILTFWIDHQHQDGIKIAAFFFAKTLECGIFALEQCLVGDNKSVRDLALNYMKFKTELGLV